MATVQRRKSKYTELVYASLLRRRHATNIDIASDVRLVYPDVSDTTVHRITQRMLADGLCQYAPHTDQGVMRFDSNVTQHDHFECAQCGILQDISIENSARDSIARAIDGCTIDGQLKIVGTCCACKNNIE